VNRNAQNNLILIPARSGSTRVKNKNIRMLDGKPLVAHTIETARASDCGRVVVSTNSEEIAEVAQSYGAEIPFLRPDSLATAHASSISAVCHALDWFRDNENWIPEIFILTPPTNPLRQASTINAMVTQLKERPDVNSIVTIKTPESHPFTILDRKDDGRIINGVIAIKDKTVNDVERSQDWPEVWASSPVCRMTRAAYFMGDRLALGNTTYDRHNCLGHEISTLEGLDIDTEDDFALAEYYCTQ